MELTLKILFGYKINPDELEEFLVKVKALGLNQITWNGYSGDQREPAMLTLTASKGRS